MRDYVLAQPGADEFLDTYERLLDRSSATATSARASGTSTIAVGCTGGKHRSVAMAEELARRLAGHGVEASVVHRDLGRE